MLPIGVFLPQGQNYLMKISSYGLNIYGLGRDFPFSGYPVHNNSALTVVKGYGNNTDQYDSYNYFYDMAVRSFGCNSGRVAVPVDIAPQPQPAFTISQQGAQVTMTNNSNGGGSYSWDFGDGNTSTVTAPVHSYTQSGTYQVKLTQTNDCGTVVTTQTIVVTLTGVNEVNAKHDQVTIYPNPASDHVVVTTANDLEEVNYSITNAVGATMNKGMLQGKTTKITLNGYAAGVYILHIATDQTRSYRILKL
jgi:PKD repeat protein